MDTINANMLCEGQGNSERNPFRIWFQKKSIGPMACPPCLPQPWARTRAWPGPQCHGPDDFFLKPCSERIPFRVALAFAYVINIDSTHAFFSCRVLKMRSTTTEGSTHKLALCLSADNCALTWLASRWDHFMYVSFFAPRFSDVLKAWGN